MNYFLGSGIHKLIIDHPAKTKKPYTNYSLATLEQRVKDSRNGGAAFGSFLPVFRSGAPRRGQRDPEGQEEPDDPCLLRYRPFNNRPLQKTNPFRVSFIFFEGLPVLFSTTEGHLQNFPNNWRADADLLKIILKGNLALEVS